MGTENSSDLPSQIQSEFQPKTVTKAPAQRPGSAQILRKLEQQLMKEYNVPKGVLDNYKVEVRIAMHETYSKNRDKRRVAYNKRALKIDDQIRTFLKDVVDGF